MPTIEEFPSPPRVLYISINEGVKTEWDKLLVSVPSSGSLYLNIKNVALKESLLTIVSVPSSGSLYLNTH